jgi:hypothetical protein
VFGEILNAPMGVVKLLYWATTYCTDWISNSF